MFNELMFLALCLMAGFLPRQVLALMAVVYTFWSMGVVKVVP